MSKHDSHDQIETVVFDGLAQPWRGRWYSANFARAALYFEGMLRVTEAELVIRTLREKLRPVNYYCRLPAILAQSHVLLLDPMRLPVAAQRRRRFEPRAPSIQFICVVV